MFPIELVSQWFDVIDVDAKFIQIFEEKTGTPFPISQKTLERYKELESQGIELKMTPAREAKIHRIQQAIDIDLSSESCFKSEKHLIAYKTFFLGMDKVVSQSNSQYSFSLINEGLKLIDEMITFARSFASAQPALRKQVFLDTSLLQRFLPHEIYLESKNHLSNLPIDKWVSDQKIKEIFIMTDIGVMLYLIACVDLEDLLRTNPCSRPDGYFTAIIPREPFEKFNPTAAKIEMWAKFAGSIRKSCNGDEDLRTTVQKWKADVERPTESKFIQWMSHIAKLKYSEFDETQIMGSIHNAWNHWKIALLLTNMKNCFIGKRKTTKYAIFPLSNRANLTSCFDRYDFYLHELRKQVGI